MECGSLVGDCVLNSGGRAGTVDLSSMQSVGSNGAQKNAVNPPHPGLSGASPFWPWRRSGFLILPIMMVVVGSWIGWRATGEDASERRGHVDHAGAEYASRVLASDAGVTERINDMLRGLSDQQIRKNTAETRATLGQLMLEPPQAVMSFVADFSGHALAAAPRFPISPDSTCADRDYFVALAAAASPNFYISQGFPERLDGRLFFAVSCRKSGGGNSLSPAEFDGGISFSVDFLSVAADMRGLLSDRDDTTTLLHADGLILAQSVDFDHPAQRATSV